MIDILPEYTQEMYEQILKNMNPLQRKILFNDLMMLSKCGVDSFGYRQIDKEGNSNVFSTCKKWISIPKSIEFNKQMLQHMNNEVYIAKHNNFNYITRSGDKIDNIYLQTLNEYGVNNSIIRYNFYLNRIDIYYFMFNNASSRDIVINNINTLNNIIISIQNPLEQIGQSKVFQSNKILLLEKKVIHSIWKPSLSNLIFADNKRNKIELSYLDKALYLSQREIQCLALIRLGISNKAIAKNMNISVLTVKDYISNLKRKLSVSTRDDLIFTAQKLDLNYLTKLIE